ncbi:hypothetical protein EV127DRAFT_488348 [Xylaria flabelliformis]|nr:hypothetical protein EV127DRAFT_488348 [Xylaria flabelliformis]
MLSEPGRMFAKPIPRYLLSRQFRETHLVCSQTEEGRCCSSPRAQEPANSVDPAAICEREELYKCAYGLLPSYTALKQYESDFHIAKDQHLLPTEVEWETWRKLPWELLKNGPKNLTRVDQRYPVGELRASLL